MVSLRQRVYLKTQVDLLKHPLPSSKTSSISLDSMAKSSKSTPTKKIGARVVKATPKKESGERKASLQKKRFDKKVAKDVETGMDSMVEHNANLDLEFLQKTWLENPALRSYTCGLVRNGLLQKGLEANLRQGALTATIDLTALGKAIVGSRGDRFRSVGSNAAIKAVDTMLDSPELNIASWFVGDGKLPADLSTKALKFGLGVTDSTPLPSDFEHWRFEGPFNMLAKHHYEKLGRRLQGVTKETLDRRTNYFNLDEDGAKKIIVVCPLFPNEKINLKYSHNSRRKMLWHCAYHFHRKKDH